MRTPRIPDKLVFLGTAIEVDGEKKSWMWRPSEKVIVASDEAGKTLYVFPRAPVKNPMCKTGMRVQSYLFDLDKFTRRTAVSWLKKHGKKTPRPDETENYLRYRQEPQSHFSFIRTGELSPGIKTTYGCPIKKWAKNPAGELLYEKFNRRKPTRHDLFDLPAPKRKIGLVHHIVYRSDKFGQKTSYIHTFEKQPTVWVDKMKNPSILVITGGNIRVTSRAITG